MSLRILATSSVETPRVWRALQFALLCALAGAAHAQDCGPDGLKLVKRGHEVRFAPRVEQIDAALKQRKFEAIAIGDSIVQQWPQDLLAKALGTEAVLNAGIGGDGAATVLGRLRGEATEIPQGPGKRAQVRIDGWSQQQPRRVLLLIGTNDLHTTGGCAVSAGVLADVNELHRMYPQAAIDVVSVLPRGDGMRQFDAAIRDANRRTAEAAKAPGAPFTFIDAHDEFLCSGRTPCPLVRPPNNVHLTREGYERLTRIVQSKLSERR